MFDTTPTTHLPGYVSDSTTITFALEDLTFPGLDGTRTSLLTAAEASSDIRKVYRALIMTIADKLSQLPTADKPQRMGVTLSSPSTNTVPSGSTNLIRRSFAGYFDESVDPSTIDVADEPT